MVGILGIAIPLVGDADTAGETDPAIHHQQLAVGAVVEAAEVVPLQRPVLLHIDPGILQALQHAVLHLDAAGPIDHHLDRDARARALLQRLGEFLADFARPVDVGFEGDRLLRAADRLQHGREDRFAVLQLGDLVAGDDARPEQHAHLAAELRVGHRVAVLDLAFQVFFGGLEVHGQGRDQQRRQGGDHDGQDHAFAAPA